MKLEDIVRGMDVLVKYDDKWWVATVTGVSKKTGWVTVWIGDYARLSVHHTHLREVKEE